MSWSSQIECMVRVSLAQGAAPDRRLEASRCRRAPAGSGRGSLVVLLDQGLGGATRTRRPIVRRPLLVVLLCYHTTVPAG
eukprot:6182958-Pleurochrysis_carterae.AAC.2